MGIIKLKRMRRLRKSKKAMFFTLITIGLIGIFLFYFAIHTYQKQSDRQEVIEKRVLSMDSFISSVERDITRGLYISGFRAATAVQEHIVETGSFVSDFDALFTEAIMNGTVDGDPKVMMAGSAFNNWIERINAQANKANIVMNIRLNDLKVFQNDSWHFIVSAELTFDIIDYANIASWHFQRKIQAPISIIGFEDPLYSIYGEGRITNIFEKSPYEGNFRGSASKLLDHTFSGYYIANPDAPSFLMRFENNLSASEFGVESLIDKKELDNLGLSPDPLKSCVDHVYWSGISTTNHPVNGTPSWFKLDTDHLDIYGVS